MKLAKFIGYFWYKIALIYWHCWHRYYDARDRLSSTHKRSPYQQELTQMSSSKLSPFVPTYAAIFCSVEGVPQVVGVFTVDEFLARWNAASQGLRWALLLSVETGEVVSKCIKLVETEEKTA